MSELAPVVSEVLRGSGEADSLLYPLPNAPIREFGLEVQGSCNFGCSNCYMYQLALAPNRTLHNPMSLEVAVLAAERISEHVDEYGADKIPGVNVVLHGGEPLLDVRLILDIANALHAGITNTNLNLRVQTNANRLTRKVMGELDAANIDIGVSMDGTRDDHNRSRPLLGGGESYDTVAANVRVLRDEFPHRFLKLLCTLGPHNMHAPSAGYEEYLTSAIETYESLIQFRPSVKDNPNWSIDFLLPHSDWDEGMRPPGWDPTGQSTPYADWYGELFDYLWKRKDLQFIHIPFIEAIIKGVFVEKGLRTTPANSELFGLADTSYVFIEPDGSIKGTDALKRSGTTADDLALNVRDNRISEVLSSPIIALRQMGRAALGPICQGCDLVTTCGGGRFSDRKLGDSFQNPSVFCNELEIIVRHIMRAVEPVIERNA